METRVAALEAGQRETAATLSRLEALIKLGLEKTDKLAGEVGKLTGDVTKLMVDVAELRGRVSQLPTTVTLIGFVLAVMAMAGLLRVFVH